MTPPRTGPVGREQDTTPFNTILLRLCDATPALGAALVDFQGETVDFAGTLDPFDIKVAAAEWRLVLDLVHASKFWSWSQANQLLARGARHSFAVVPLGDGYAIVAQLQRHAFGLSERAVAEAARGLCREAGIELAARGDAAQWARVEVRTTADDARRPDAIWLDGRWSSVVILGRYREQELPPGEVGYRVRIAAETDVSLIREPLGVWYADDLAVE
jgi:hypothetical protein